MLLAIKNTTIMSTHINFRGKMIPASFAVDELKTEKGAQTAVDKWRKAAKMHLDLANDELAKVTNYNERIRLAEQKYSNIK